MPQALLTMTESMKTDDCGAKLCFQSIHNYKKQVLRISPKQV
jgi:hypothetical protein